MSAPSSDGSALGTARGRFVASLPRKAVELRGVIALLTSTPAAVAPRDEMRRRLQTLYASALVFRDEALAELVKGGIERIDLAQQQGRGLTTYDLENLARIVAQLPSLHRTERGVAVLTAALRDEDLPDPEADDAAMQAELDAQLPEVTDSLELSGERDGGAGQGPVAPSGAADEPADPAFHSPGAPRREAGVPIGGVQVVSARVRKHPQVTEEYSERALHQTLTGVSPIEAEQGRAGGERAPAGMRQGPPATARRPSEPPVVEYGSEDDQARRSAPPGPGEGHMRLSSAPIVAAGSGRGAARSPLLQRVVRVLVLDAADRHAQIRLQLPRSSFEVTHAEDPETALRLSRSEGPDVVVANRALGEQADFIRRLRSDPLTDFVPVVLLQGGENPLDPVAARELGADELLAWPTSSHVLAESIGRLTGTLVDEGNPLAALGEASLEEVADRVAEEIRHGLVDSVEAGRDLRVPLGGGAEVLAAAWAAVARVRSFVAQQSAGRIRFRDLPVRGGPALLALVDGETSTPSAEQGSLQGRCILVVDDDPAVVWFFAGLLREQGATVLEAHDGQEALEMARGRRPDVVISDILMPGLDGYALCRALQRDPLLADVPVILLSWKEDLLHRMRELQAGASGYLRKEAAAAQILGRVREVLRSRRELEQSLIAGGEVRGSLEGIGLVGMLRSVARCRPNSRLTVRDAWNVFEIELRQGTIAALTRTSSDGALERGAPALSTLLGAVAGRFAITDSTVQLKPQFQGNLDDVLVRGARSLGALIDAVSGAGLLRARAIEFDPDALALVRSQSPGPVRDLVERLHEGAAPAEVLLASDTSAQTLEAVLIDLARRGAIRGVAGGRGEDLVARALEERGGEPAATAAHVLVPKWEQGEGAQASSGPRPAPDARGAEDDRGLLPELDFGQTDQTHQGAPQVPAEGQEKTTARLRAGRSGRGVTSVPSAVPTDPAPAPEAPRDSAPSPPVEEAEAGLSWGWLLMLVALVGIGFAGARYLQSRPATAPEVAQVEPVAPPPASVPEPAPAEEPEPEPLVADESLEPLPPSDGLVVPQDVGFQIYEGITDSTVDVGERQGLLIVGAEPGRPTLLRVDGQPAGELPVKQPLDEGIHTLELEAPGDLQVLFVAVSPGKTWVLAKP